MTQPIVFSGAQPSGGLTLGNYIGALKNWVKMQEDHDCLYCVVDLHSLTVRQDPKALQAARWDALLFIWPVGLTQAKAHSFSNLMCLNMPN